MLSKQDVLKTLQDNLQLIIEDFDPAAFDPTKSLLDLGANSIETVEIVSRSMRDLNVKVPRVRLGSVENIDQLADEFVLASAGS